VAIFVLLALMIFPTARSRDIPRRMPKPQAKLLMRSGSRYVFLSRDRAPKALRPPAERGPPSILIWGTPMRIDPTW
jgi:hypothetical protein